MTLLATTPISGISYYYPHPQALIEARDGLVQIAYGDVPIPLLEEDLAALDDGSAPSYDMLGRGVYHALRANPDCLHASRYAQLLQQGYPHFISELGSLIVMLDHKDVDALYMDRKINYLKIFALLDPTNPQFPLEIGRTYLQKGLGLMAHSQISRSLFLAEEFLLQAAEMGATDLNARADVAEVSYVLGRYERAIAVWEQLQPEIAVEEREKLVDRLVALKAGKVPLVPVVDYLEAVVVAIDAFERQDLEEASAILQDVVTDRAFSAGYPVAEIWYILGRCSSALASPALAKEYLQMAVQIRPDYTDALRALNEL
jgi:tetratricopeptide (TPR) repeat protein